MKLNNKIIVLVLLIFVALFYWFQIRPAQIRKECQKWAYEQGNQYFSYEFLKDKTAFEKSQLQVEYMDGAYNRCIHGKGLK